MKVKNTFRYLFAFLACMFVVVSVASALELGLKDGITLNQDKDEKKGCTSTQQCCRYEVDTPGLDDYICRTSCLDTEVIVKRDKCAELPRAFVPDDIIDLMIDLDDSLRQLPLPLDSLSR